LKKQNALLKTQNQKLKCAKANTGNDDVLLQKISELQRQNADLQMLNQRLEFTRLSNHTDPLVNERRQQQLVDKAQENNTNNCPWPCFRDMYEAVTNWCGRFLQCLPGDETVKIVWNDESYNMETPDLPDNDLDSPTPEPVLILKGATKGKNGTECGSATETQDKLNTLNFAKTPEAKPKGKVSQHSEDATQSSNNTTKTALPQEGWRVTFELDGKERNGRIDHTDHSDGTNTVWIRYFQRTLVRFKWPTTKIKLLEKKNDFEIDFERWITPDEKSELSEKTRKLIAETEKRHKRNLESAVVLGH
jgi:hypothetical protein